MTTDLIIRKEFQYISQDPLLMDDIYDLASQSQGKGKRPIIDSLMNTGKTTMLSEFSKRYKEDTNRTTISALPTIAIKDNKSKEGITFGSSGDGLRILNENPNIDMIEGVYDSAIRLLKNVIAEDYLFSVDEVHHLYQSMGFRTETILKILETARYFIGLSGTPLMFNYHPDYDVIRIRHEKKVESKKVYFSEHDKFSFSSLAKGILRDETEHIAKGNPIVLRINNYESMVKVRNDIKKRNPEYKIGSSFSSSSEGNGRNFKDCNSSKNEVDFVNLQKNIISEDLDVVLTTQLSDEGVDMTLKGLNKLGKPRHVNFHILNPKTPILDENGIFKCSYTSNSNPEIVAQVSNRERSGFQTTTLHGHAGESKVLDYITLINYKLDKGFDSKVQEYEYLNKLQQSRNDLTLDEMKSEFAQYNIEIVEKETPATEHVKDSNLRDGELRKYLIYHHNFKDYKSVMDSSGNHSFIPPQIERTPPDNMYSRLGSIISIESTACRLGIPFEYFINSKRYESKTRNVLIEAFVLINNKDSNPKTVKMFKELLDAKDELKLDTKELFDRQGKSVRSIIKKVANLLFSHSNKWKRKTITLTYDFEADYPQYWKDNESLKPKAITLKDLQEAKEIELSNDADIQLELPLPFNIANRTACEISLIST